MNIFQNIFHSRDKPPQRLSAKDSLPGSSYSFFFGSTTSGKSVNENTAMQMTAVYSCVRILSEAVAGLPLGLYRYKDSGGKEKAPQHPLDKLLHDEPNPEMTSFAFRETLMGHLMPMICRSRKYRKQGCPCFPMAVTRRERIKSSGPCWRTISP